MSDTTNDVDRLPSVAKVSDCNARETLQVNVIVSLP